MIHWLVQSSAGHPDLARGVPPNGLLSPQEQAHLAALRTQKRRRDWLLGRWTSKQMLQAVIWQETGVLYPLDALRIERDARGAPVALCRHGKTTWNLPVVLSISHSGDRAFCAVTAAEAGPMGADMERIEARELAFTRDYFIESEQAVLEQASARYPRDLLVTVLWCAKEAALKALRLGLTVDTRLVSCTLDLPAEPADDWIPFRYRWEQGQTGNGAHSHRPCSQTPPEAVPLASGCSSLAKHLPWDLKTLPPLKGWWRVSGDYVLALAAQA